MLSMVSLLKIIDSVIFEHNVSMSLELVSKEETVINAFFDLAKPSFFNKFYLLKPNYSLPYELDGLRTIFGSQFSYIFSVKLFYSNIKADIFYFGL